MKSRTYKAMLGTLELTVCTRLSWKLERSSCLCVLRAGIKSICFYFSVFCLWQITLCRPGQTGYILYSIQVLSDVLVWCFYSRQVEVKRLAWVNSLLWLWHPEIGLRSLVLLLTILAIFFFNETVVLRNCVCIGIILSRPGWYLTSSLICNTVRSYSYIYQLNSILCWSIVIKFKLLVFPNQVLRISSLCLNDVISWNERCKFT